MLKEKQHQEVMELEKKHAAQITRAEISIAPLGVQMYQSHGFQRQGLQNRLNEENKMRLDIRALSQNKLDGKCYIESHNLEEQVFKSFEKYTSPGKLIEGSKAQKSPVLPRFQRSSSPPHKDFVSPSPEKRASKRQKIHKSSADTKFEDKTSPDHSPANKLYDTPFYSSLNRGCSPSS
jgi:hypothetical protein